MMMPLLLPQQSSATSSSPASVADRIAMSYDHYHHHHHHHRNTHTEFDFPKMPQTIKSQSIPISSGMHRTASEVQLCEDEVLADYRDYIVYSRIVNGISRQQEKSHNIYLRQENDKCLAHIVSTRNTATAGGGGYGYGYGYPPDTTLQSLSHHIAQGVAIADDYFCGEEPPEAATTTSTSILPSPSSADIVNGILVDEEEDDEGIFTLEL